MALLTSFALAFALATGCAEPPLFDGINQVKVRQVGPRGMTFREITGSALVATRTCLLNNTSEVTEAETDINLLQEPFLFEVTDRRGTRSYELYTARNFKGNRGRYFENRCIHKLVAG